MTDDPHHSHAPLMIQDDFPDLHSEVYGDRILFDIEEANAGSCPENPSGHIYFGKPDGNGGHKLTCQYCEAPFEP